MEIPKNKKRDYIKILRSSPRTYEIGTSRTKSHFCLHLTFKREHEERKVWEVNNSVPAGLKIRRAQAKNSKMFFISP